MPACAQHRESDPCADSRGEAGFTLMELLVVMVIIAIVMAITSMQFMSTRKSAGTLVGVAVARAYADAVGAYAADHNGIVPASIGGNGWTNAKDGPASPMARGPLNGRYLKTIPEAVSDNRIGIGTAGDMAMITYTATSPTRFYMIVRKRDNTPICYTGTAVPPSPPQPCRDVD